MPYPIGQRTVYRIGECREFVRVRTLKDFEYQDYTTLQDACRKTGKPFEDPEFNPNGPDDLIGAVELISMKAQLPRWNGKFYWKRPSEMAPPGVKVDFSRVNTSDGALYSKSDINQGGLGDCWYLSSLSLIITQKELMEFLIPLDNNTDIELGIYHFRFWHKGIFVDVVVDDRIPYWDQDGFGLLTPAFCTIADNEIWPNMLEKAYAKLHRSYFGIEGGWVSYGLEDFTGGVSEMIDLSNKPPNLFNILNDNNKLGNFMGFSSVFDDALEKTYGLVKGHAYALVGVDTVQVNGNTVQLIRLRNPWGNAMEWTGDWCDSSSKWKDVSQADRDRLLVQKPDGQFWMEYETATSTKFFFLIDLCHWYNDIKYTVDIETLPLQYEKHDGKWIGETAAGKDTIEAIVHNPQYVIQLKKEIERAGEEEWCLLIVSLLHKGYVENKLRLPGFGYKIYQIDNTRIGNTPPFSADDINSGKLKDIGHATFSYEQVDTGAQYFRDVNTVFNLPAGSYVIIPCTQHANREGDYLLRILSEGNFGEKYQAKGGVRYTIELGPTGVGNDGPDVPLPIPVVVPEPVPIVVVPVPTPTPAVVPEPTPVVPEPPTPTPVVPEPTPVPQPAPPVVPEPTPAPPPTPTPPVETEVEKIFRTVSGDDKMVDVKELKGLLNYAFKDLPKFKGFSDETVRALLTVCDYDFDGKLGYLECCELYPKIKKWTSLFVEQDSDHNGYLNYFEFSRLILYGLNYYLPVYTIQLLYGRYASFRGMNIDSFMLGAAKVHVANRIYEQRKLDNASHVFFSRDNWINHSISF